jgi:hypothetical protein
VHTTEISSALTLSSPPTNDLVVAVIDLEDRFDSYVDAAASLLKSQQGRATV